MAKKITQLSNVPANNIANNDVVTGIHNNDNANFQLSQLKTYIFNSIKTDVETLIDNALQGQDFGLTEQQVNELIDTALQEQDFGLSETEVNNAIDTKLENIELPKQVIEVAGRTCSFDEFSSKPTSFMVIGISVEEEVFDINYHDKYSNNERLKSELTQYYTQRYSINTTKRILTVKIQDVPLGEGNCVIPAKTTLRFPLRNLGGSPSNTFRVYNEESQSSESFFLENYEQIEFGLKIGTETIWQKCVYYPDISVGLYCSDSYDSAFYNFEIRIKNESDTDITTWVRDSSGYAHSVFSKLPPFEIQCQELNRNIVGIEETQTGTVNDKYVNTGNRNKSNYGYSYILQRGTAVNNNLGRMGGSGISNSDLRYFAIPGEISLNGKFVFITPSTYDSEPYFTYRLVEKYIQAEYVEDTEIQSSNLKNTDAYSIFKFTLESTEEYRTNDSVSYAVMENITLDIDSSKIYRASSNVNNSPALYTYVLGTYGYYVIVAVNDSYHSIMQQYIGQSAGSGKVYYYSLTNDTNNYTVANMELIPNELLNERKITVPSGYKLYWNKSHIDSDPSIYVNSYYRSGAVVRVVRMSKNV